jgi:hypothetical protein
MAIGGAIGELPPGVVYLPKPWQPLNVFIIAEQALSSSRGYRSELVALAKTVAEISFGCDDATRQLILDDLAREISEFEAEYASTSGSEMRHGQRPVLSRPRFDL